MSEPLGLLFFLIASVLLAYTYGIYPLILALLATLLGKRPIRSPQVPSISIIITAHNEAGAIAAKLDNTLSLDYPTDRLEIIVASDASTDGTDEVVRRYADRGVRLVRAPARGGKTAATQRAVRASSGEFLVFSDATGLYSSKALRSLMSLMSDPHVGCVSGRVTYRYGDSLLSRGFRMYQGYVIAVRKMESSCGVLTSVSGSIHAVRRASFPFVESHQNYDLLLPLDIAHHCLSIVYDTDALSVEVSRQRPREEFQARVRAGINAFSVLTEIPSRSWLVSNPLFLFTFMSNKVLRWLTPLWIILLLVGHVLLATTGTAWTWTLLPHAGLYVLAALGAVLPSSRATRWLSGPLFVGTVCAAFFVGLVSFLLGKRATQWESPH